MLPIPQETTKSVEIRMASSIAPDIRQMTCVSIIASGFVCQPIAGSKQQANQHNGHVPHDHDEGQIVRELACCRTAIGAIMSQRIHRPKTLNANRALLVPIHSLLPFRLSTRLHALPASSITPTLRSPDRCKLLEPARPFRYDNQAHEVPSYSRPSYR